MQLSTFFILTILGVSYGSDVAELSYDNYYQALAKHDAVLLEFYAPWCGHCKQLAPLYEQIATKLKGKALVAKCDATDDVELAEEFDVSGYPTIFLFKGTASVKNPIKYEGAREVDPMVKFVERHLGEVVKPIASQSDLDKFTEGSDVSVVATGTKEFLKKYKKLAEQLRSEYTFGVVTGDVTGFEPGQNSVRVYSPETHHTPVAERPVLSDLPKKGEKLAEWISESSFPTVIINASEESFERASSRQTPVFIGAAKPDNEAFTKAVQAVAEQHKGKGLLFMTRDSSSQSVKMQIGSLGYTGGDAFPAWCIAHQAKDKKFCSDGKAEEDKLEEQVGDFVSKYFAGKLKKALKSEPMENGVTVKGLTTVIGNTFARDITNNKDKDILLEFYAPWCGHCKALTPEYETLAAQLESTETVVIAKIDATANEWKEKKKFDVSGYPTLFFIKARADPKSKPTIMPYNGARTAEGMLEFIKANARHPIAVSSGSADSAEGGDEASPTEEN